MLWVAILGVVLLSYPTSALRSAQRGQSFQISPKPCWVDGVEGTCMFVWECIKSKGYHIGMCVDTFMFGSCCAYNATENEVLPANSGKPAVLYTPPSHHINNRPTSIHSRPQHNYRPTTVVRPMSRPATAPPMRHSVRPMSTDSLAVANSLSLGSYTKPGWQITTEPGFITSHNSIPSGLKPAAVAAVWQTSTEPNFVTRPKNKPSSSPKPKPSKPSKKPIHHYQQLTTTKTTIKFSSKPPRTTNRPKTTTSRSSPTTTSTTTSTTTTSTTTTQSPTSAGLVMVTETPYISVQNVSLSPDMMPTSTIPSIDSSSTESTVRCGVPQLFPQPQTRIVGGKNAPFGRWPWQVSVRRTSFFGFSSTHRCGGAVLNENWIATAGHCVDDLLTSQIRIRVGEYDFSNVQEELPYVERAVGRKVVHPKYNFFTYEYDLALVRLDKPLEFAPHISPICLPASDDLLIGENATVTGWGRLSEGGTLPSVLQEVQVPIVSNDRCKSMFLRAGRHEFIPEIFLCAGHENGGQDSCQGDSGGPLQVRGKDGRYFLAGIISWGIGCAEANLPGVCTRISKFVPWILKNVT